MSILFPYFFHIISIFWRCPESAALLPTCFRTLLEVHPIFCPHLEVPPHIWDASRHQGSQNLWSLGESKAHEVRYRAMFQQHLQNIVKIATFIKFRARNQILCCKNLCLVKVRWTPLKLMFGDRCWATVNSNQYVIFTVFPYRSKVKNCVLRHPLNSCKNWCVCSGVETLKKHYVYAQFGTQTESNDCKKLCIWGCVSVTVFYGTFEPSINQR